LQPGADTSGPAAKWSGCDGCAEKTQITYTWKRQRVKHVVADPAELVLRDLVDGLWPQ
jgi:hypothetical protein